MVTENKYFENNLEFTHKNAQSILLTNSSSDKTLNRFLRLNLKIKFYLLFTINF